ncbi:MAG: TROVE domain-containing protein [Bacteroidetes bacterium]|nr:TROVE domain-containing protein [Bacteroidota bacterium]
MKFNLLSKAKTRVTNYEGVKAFVLRPDMELYTAVVTWSLNDSFYEKDEQRLSRLRTLMAKCDPLFIGKLAVYARNKMYMRSVPLVLVTELAKLHSGDNLVARVTDGVIGRADEITELLACYDLLNGRKGPKRLNGLSKQLQKGLQAAFNKFDEYQFAKYNRPAEVKLRDALFLVHPKAKDAAQQALFDKIAGNTLETPYTWETELSALGQLNFDSEEAKAAAFRAKWEELVDSGKLGYMAMLRNLRNMLEAGISYAHLQKVCATLASAEQVAKAKQFPFRYLAAYRELLNLDQAQLSALKKLKLKLTGASTGYTGEMLDALEKAVQASAANIKGFDANTRVLLACDVSGSMQKPVSAKSKVLLYDIGLMLAMLLQSRCRNVQVGMFGDSWKTITVPHNYVLGNVQEFYKREGEVGYSTNGYLVIKDLLNRRVKVDKIMLFTDRQLWNSSSTTGDHIQPLWLRYKAEVAPEARLYLFDLQGYGQSPLQLLRNDVYLVAGWSDKIFEVLDALEKGGSALDEINKIAI